MLGISLGLISRRASGGAGGPALGMEFTRRGLTVESLFASGGYAAWVNDPAYADRLGVYSGAAGDTTFASLVTFTRAGTATDADAYGVQQSHPANEPRMGFDAGLPAGLLMETADRAAITGAAFASVLSGDAGWLMAEVLMPTNTGAVRSILQLDTGADTNRVELRPNTAATGIAFIVTVAGSQGGPVYAAGGAPTFGAAYRAALRWGGGSLSVAHAAGSNTAAQAIPAGLANLRMGINATGSSPLMGRVRAVWGGREQPADATLVAMCQAGADVAAVLRG